MIRTYTFSAAGGHAINEDAFALRALGDGWFVALADGQGGAPAARGPRSSRVRSPATTRPMSNRSAGRKC